MLETFLKYCGDHWPSMTVGGIIVVAAIIITWKISVLVHHWGGRIVKTEEDCKKIDGHIMPKLSNINDSLITLNGSFNNLIMHLSAKDQGLNAGLFISRSPIQLTPLGWEVLNAIGGKDYIDKYADVLIYDMDAIGVKTALDSQTIAPLVINKVSQKDTFTNIKNYAFKNPIYRTTDKNTGKAIEISIDMSTISNVMGIYLRDKYLERHPELNPEDIPSTV